MSHQQLTKQERILIEHWIKFCTPAEIARRLGRHRSTISRELRRLSSIWHGKKYHAEYAHRDATKKRQDAAVKRRKMAHAPLKDYVIDKMILKWSPETISGRLKREYPNDPRMQISHEAIYQTVYSLPGRRVRLYQLLLRKHSTRKCRNRGISKNRRQIIKDRISIHDRPEYIEHRNTFGHWEGDTVRGKISTGCILTQVERKSRFIIGRKLDSATSEKTTEKMIRSLKHLPKALRKSMTLDNGSEFAGHLKFSKATKMKVYFSDAYASWQRGTNENTNGRLRRYIPKGVDMRKVSQYDLAKAIQQMNRTPRKCLDYQTPEEVFLKACDVAFQS